MYCNGRLTNRKCIILLYSLLLVFVNERMANGDSVNNDDVARISERIPFPPNYPNERQRAAVVGMSEGQVVTSSQKDALDRKPILAVRREFNNPKFYKDVDDRNDYGENTKYRINRKYHNRQDYSKVLKAKKYQTPIYSQLNIPHSANRDTLKHVKLDKIIPAHLYDDYRDRLGLENGEYHLNWERLLSNCNNHNLINLLHENNKNNRMPDDEDIQNTVHEDDDYPYSMDDLDKLSIGPKIDYALDFDNLLSDYRSNKARKSSLELNEEGPYEDYCRPVDSIDDDDDDDKSNPHKRSNLDQTAITNTNLTNSGNTQKSSNYQTFTDNNLQRRQIVAGQGALGGVGTLGSTFGGGVGGAAASNSAYPSVLTKAVEISINPSNKVTSGNLLENVAKKMNTSALQLAKQIAKSPDPINALSPASNLLAKVPPITREASLLTPQFSVPMVDDATTTAPVVAKGAVATTAATTNAAGGTAHVVEKEKTQNWVVPQQLDKAAVNENESSTSSTSSSLSRYSQPSSIEQVLDKVLLKLEQLQEKKSETKLPDGAPCNVVGNWTSQSLGVCFHVHLADTLAHPVLTLPESSNKMLVVDLVECVPPRRHRIIDMEWKFSGSALKEIGGPFYLHAQKTSENTLGSFLGFCRICGGIDTIFGSWTFLSPTKDCSDTALAFDVKADNLRRNNMEAKRRDRFKELLYEKHKKTNG